MASRSYLDLLCNFVFSQFFFGSMDTLVGMDAWYIQGIRMEGIPETPDHCHLGSFHSDLAALRARRLRHFVELLSISPTRDHSIARRQSRGEELWINFLLSPSLFFLDAIFLLTYEVVLATTDPPLGVPFLYVLGSND